MNRPNCTKYLVLSIVAVASLTSSYDVLASTKGDAAFGLHLGIGTQGGGDTNGQMPHTFYYRGNFVTASGLEGNLSLAMQTVGQRFRVTEKLDFGLHAGFSTIADGLNSKSKPAAYFSVNLQPFCYWLCFGVDSYSGLALNSYSSKPILVPVSSFTVGLYLWY